MAAVALSAEVAPEEPSPLPPATVVEVVAGDDVEVLAALVGVDVPADAEVDADSLDAAVLAAAVVEVVEPVVEVLDVVVLELLLDVVLLDEDADVPARSPGWATASTTPMARTISAAAPSTLAVRRFRALSSSVGGKGGHCRSGAGDGNRTRMASLEGWSSAIELRPHDRGEGSGATQHAPSSSIDRSRAWICHRRSAFEPSRGGGI